MGRQIVSGSFQVRFSRAETNTTKVPCHQRKATVMSAYLAIPVTINTAVARNRNLSLQQEEAQYGRAYRIDER